MLIRLMALAGLLGAVCCLSIAAGPAPARAAGPGLGECRPLLWPEAGSGTVTCYQPTHAALAERVAPVRAIDPATAVRHVVALPLTQTLIFHGTPGGVRGRPGIVYVFGRPPTRSCPPGAHCPRPNDFVVVWEMGGRVTARGVTIRQTAYASFATWRATAATRGHRLSITVDSNAGEAQVLQIAQAIALLVPAHVAGAAATPPGPGECRALVAQVGTGPITCYRSAHITMAERSLPFRPVTPVAAVRATVQVPLTQVVVFQGTPGYRRGRPAIAYVFGTPNGAVCPPRARCSHLPRYVVVSEGFGRVRVQGLVLIQQYSGAWLLMGNVPGRNVSLTITSNYFAQAVRAIGQRITGATS